MEDGPLRCECDRFYVGDGYRCAPGPDAGCDIKRDCDPDAECVLDPDSFTFNCRCADGFSGDGYRCRRDVIGCNIIDDCGEHAQCHFDVVEGGYRCRCDEAKVSGYLSARVLLLNLFRPKIAWW